MRSEVKEYVKKKRGGALYAANGGLVPGDDEELGGDDEEAGDEADASDADAEDGADAGDDAPEPADAPAADSAKAAAAADDVLAPPVPGAAGADEERQSALKKYLTEKYGQAADDSAIKTAQEDAAWKNKVAGFGQGLMNFVGARGVANGAAPDDGKAMQAIRNQGAAGVEQATKARDQSVQGFLQKNALERQVVQDQMTKGDFQNRQAAAKRAADLAAPGSDISIAKVTAAQQLFPEDLKGIDPKSMSANDVDKFVALKVKDRETGELAKSRRGHQKEVADARTDAANEKKNAAELKLANDDFKRLGDDLDVQEASGRKGVSKAQGKVDSANNIMTFADVKPEEIDAAKKYPKVRAALIAKLNTLTPPQYAEVVTGLMGQLNNGGQGSLGQLHELKADTADQTKANLLTYFSSHPIGADAGELILNNLNTLKNEQANSQKILDTHMAQMEKKHPKAFAHPETAENAKALFAAWARKPEEGAAPAMPVAKSAGGDGTAQAGTGKTLAKKQFNAKLNKTKLIYSDGTEEIVDGQK